jgi:undecaprenyl pyrophosphate synthase
LTNSYYCDIYQTNPFALKLKGLSCTHVSILGVKLKMLNQAILNSIANTKGFFTKEEIRLPETICIFPDGNGRFAKSTNQTIQEGYEAGIQNLFAIIRILTLLEAKQIFIMLFTQQNYETRKVDMDNLCKEIVEKLFSSIDYFEDNNISIRFAGDRSIFTPEHLNLIANLENVLADKPIKICLGVNYSAKQDITKAGGDFRAIEFPYSVDMTIRTGSQPNGLNIPPMASMANSDRNRIYFVTEPWPNFTIRQLLLLYTNYQNSALSSEDLF